MDNEDEVPEHLSDDDDDAKLTTNQKAAVDMEPPTRLKKVEKKTSAIINKQSKGKNGKNSQAKLVEFDEPITT